MPVFYIVKMITFIFLFTLYWSSFALNINQPKACVDCRFYIKNAKYAGTVDEDHFGKCSLFPVKNAYFSITNSENVEIQPDHLYCSTARSFKDKCGKNGSFFKIKKMKKFDNKFR